MTPLEIHLLLNLYTTTAPKQRYAPAERTTPAMLEAFDSFKAKGLLAMGVNHGNTMIHDPCATRQQLLSAKGMMLVERIMEVQP